MQFIIFCDSSILIFPVQFLLLTSVAIISSFSHLPHATCFNILNVSMLVVASIVRRFHLHLPACIPEDLPAGNSGPCRELIG